MGDRQLAAFIKYNVPGGYKDVSIIYECEKFQR